MADFKYKKQCPNCAKQGKDSNRDNLAVYSDDSVHCFSCGYTVSSKNISSIEDVEYIPKMSKTKITKAEYKAIVDNTSKKGKLYRGISDETYSFYGVRHEFNPTTGKVVRQYYPSTIKYQLTGYKTRIDPKDFSKPIGIVGKECELFGQIRFKDSTSKYVMISAGEIDAMSGYQMLRESQVAKGNGDWPAIPVVSGTTGEKSTADQCKKEYEWLDRFDRIYVCMDNDETGKEATEKLIQVLPRGKVYIISLNLKDINKYLEERKQKEFVALFYSAKRFVPSGVTTSMDLEDKMLEYVKLPRISLPKYMHKMEDMLCGGFPLGYIVNILSASGTGKSTYVDSMILHWVMNTDMTVGIVSLEASEGEYGVNLSSAYCGLKVNLLPTVEDRVNYLSKPENISLRQLLWTKEDGSPRFYLIDPDIETLQSKVEYLIVALGCKVIVLDPLQDVFDALPEDAQAKFMKWQKDVCKREKITFININHSRKSGKGQVANSQGADLHEEDMMGHSSIFKSGGINIVLQRNKEADDEIERNTTYSKITKARGVGKTGPAGIFYYENETHTLHDKEEYFRNRVSY